MSKTRKMSSAEFGAIWTTYHKKTMILRILEGLIAKSDDAEAKNLMSDLHKELDKKVLQMKVMIEDEGAAIPVGFTSNNVNHDAPKLLDNGLDIMFCRVLKQISMGMYVLHMTVSYLSVKKGSHAKCMGSLFALKILSDNCKKMLKY